MISENGLESRSGFGDRFSRRGPQGRSPAVSRFGECVFRRRLLVLFVALIAGCTITPADPDPTRRVEPPVESLLPRFPYEIRDVGPREITYRTYSDTLRSFVDQRVVVRTPESPGPWPVIAICPILGGAESGYLECEISAWVFASRGFASFYLPQPERIVGPGDDAVAVESKLRESVRRTVQALDAVAEAYPVDLERAGCFGISLGGIRAILVASADPRYRAVVSCLSGSNLAGVFSESDEGLIVRYRRGRALAIGVYDESVIVEDLERSLRTDPGVAAASIPTEEVFLFLARCDTRVPTHRGRDLHRALGRPTLGWSPLGHYSSLLALPWALGHAADFYERRFEVRTESRP